MPEGSPREQAGQVFNAVLAMAETAWDGGLDMANGIRHEAADNARRVGRVLQLIGDQLFETAADILETNRHGKRGK